jgi:hypothetical protein
VDAVARRQCRLFKSAECGVVKALPCDVPLVMGEQPVVSRIDDGAMHRVTQ